MPKSKAPAKLSKVYNATLPIAALKPHERNYKRHPDEQLSDLEASLARWSQVQSVVVHDQGDGSYTIIAGHGLIEAAQREGFQEIDARVMGTDWPAEEASGYLVADNKLGEKAEDDLEQLVSLLQEQLDAGYPLESLGSSVDDLEALLQELEAQTVGSATTRDANDPTGGGDDFDAEPEEGQTRCQPGDVWGCGNHKIACINSLDREAVLALLGDDTPSFIFSDPPYGIKIVAANVPVGGGEAYDIPFGGVKSPRGDVGGSAAHIRKTGKPYIAENRAAEGFGSVGGIL